MNNDKKMPQDKDLDQKKPQNDRGIGQPHGFENKDKQQQSSVKPDVNKDSNVKPQSAKSSKLDDDNDLDDQNEVDDEDDRITQRSPSRGNEPQRQK